jgi:2'-5' RNA ligase
MTERFFLWLLPPTPVCDRFASLIDTLSRRWGTPRFSPHITLVGSLDSPLDEIVARLTTLAADLAPVPVRLTHLGWTEQYFRCLFMRAERTPPLLAAHETASARLDRPTDADFMPHLSLIYGNLHAEQKQKVVEEIAGRFNTAFEADHIGLCLADGPPEQWQLLRTFALTGHPVA